jgi:hypothetical protein
MPQWAYSAVCGYRFALIFFPASVLADDYKVFQAGCEALKSSKVKMERCLALVNEEKVSKMYFPNVYYELAVEFFELHDYAQAIRYTRLEIEVASENLKRRFGDVRLSALPCR